MPAPLPPNSGYTYCFELTADEVTKGGVKVNGKDLLLSKPAVFYLDNFLNFPPGVSVPTGYYDNHKAAWVASDSGRVIKVVAVQNGLADVDAQGDDKPSDAEALAKLGITEAERKQLASLYKPGQSLWRVQVPHFSTWDCNWGFSPPPDAEDPDSETEGDPDGQNCICPPCDIPAQSVVGIQNQTLGEEARITGTPFRLHYRSDRVPGRTAARSVRIRLTGDKIPQSLKRVELDVQVAGQRFLKDDFPAKPGQSFTFLWDGKDAQGRVAPVKQLATVRIGYVYGGVYDRTERFGTSGNRQQITGSQTRQEVVFWREHKQMIGGWDARHPV